MKELSQRLQIFMACQQSDALLHIEEIVRIYANSNYLDKNVLFILAEYILTFYHTIPTVYDPE